MIYSIYVAIQYIMKTNENIILNVYNSIINENINNVYFSKIK